MGIIPIRTNKVFKNRILNLTNPGKEFNVNKIHRANNFFHKKTTIGYIRIINLFPFCGNKILLCINALKKSKRTSSDPTRNGIKMNFSHLQSD